MTTEYPGAYDKRIVERLKKQREKGLKKYNTTLEENDLKLEERLNYLAEELVDGLQYIEHILTFCNEAKHNVSIAIKEIYTTLRVMEATGDMDRGVKEIREYLKFIEGYINKL